MNADRLLALYDRVSEAPDAVASLRRFVLDLAVRGKLVEQDPEDESATVLLNRIASARKSVSTSARKTKRKTVDSSLAKIDFTLPTGWASAQLYKLVRVVNGRAYKKTELLNAGTPVLRVGNLFTSNRWYYSNLELEEDKYCDKGDLIYAWSASFGPFIWAGPRVIYHYHIWKLPLFTETNLSKRFLYYFLLQKTQEIKAAGHGISMLHMTKGKIEQLAVPLPPLAEQGRIVAKIQELMAICDRLEEARNALEETRDRLTKATLAHLYVPNTDSATFRSDARFAINVLPSLTTHADQVTILRQTILDLAVRGKLVEQDPRDEPATELAMRVAAEKKRQVKSHSFQEPRNARKITRQDLPFLPPDHWRWARLIDIARVSYGFPFKSSLFNSQKRGMPLIRIRDISSTDTHAYFEGDYDPAYVVRAGDFLVGMDGRFNVCRWKGQDGLLNQRVMRINDWYGDIDPEFVKLPLQMVLDYIHRETSLTTVKHLSAKQVNGIEIPLAPLAEQRRIVAKVGELTTLCNRLAVGLHAIESNRRDLLDSVLHEALHDVP